MIYIKKWCVYKYMLIDLLIERLELGRAHYGHGLRVDDNTTDYGTPVNSWLHMALEEYLDAYIYVLCDYIRNCDTYIRRQTDEDDNQRILYLIENPHEIKSKEHAEMLEYIEKLIEMTTL